MKISKTALTILEFSNDISKSWTIAFLCDILRKNGWNYQRSLGEIYLTAKRPGAKTVTDISAERLIAELSLIENQNATIETLLKENKR